MLSPCLVLASKIRERSRVSWSQDGEAISRLSWSTFFSGWVEYTASSWCYELIDIHASQVGVEGCPPYRQEHRPLKSPQALQHEMHVRLLVMYCPVFFILGCLKYLNFDLESFSFPVLCFFEIIWFLKMLFFVDTRSLHALQNSLPSRMVRFSFGNCATRSCKLTFFASDFPLSIFPSSWSHSSLSGYFSSSWTTDCFCHFVFTF